MELNKILSSTWDWGQVAAALNSNFEKIRLELLKVRFASILTFCKGYFSTEARFLAKFPSGKTGEYAFVGSPWPGTVWEWIDTNWVDTGVAPQLGEGIFMELLKRHIDNETVYWDEENQVIKARGGAVSTYSVTVEIASDSIGKCSLTAVGDGVGVSSNADKSQYIVAVPVGGSATVNVVVAEGYQVKFLMVDGVSKGAVNSFTFENVQEVHTMEVVMEVSEEVPVEFLVRSDLPDYYYSSTQDALNAVRATYPNGLTQDVTITCVKPAKEKRGSNTWVAALANWNRDSVYMLTIDGSGKLIYDCMSLGGLKFDHVDNIVCRNVDFINYSNNVDAYSPDETGSISFVGDAENYSRNLYLENCRMNGISTSQADKKAYYSIITKNTENIYIVGSRIEGCYCIPMKMVDCRFLSLIKNYVQADVSYGIIGHPALCLLSNSHGLIAEDNTFTGDTGEYFFSMMNVERAIFRRNTFKDGGGEAVNVTSKVAMKELTFEGNLFVNMLSKPSVAWAYNYVIFTCNIEKVRLLNNTAYMKGVQWQQWFMRATNTQVGEVELFNNIIADATGEGKPMYGISMGMVDTIHSGNNIYQLKLKSEGIANNGLFSAEGLTNTNSLSALQAQGLEADSILVGTDERILDNSYRLLSELSYYSDMMHASAADIEYKAPVPGNNSRGCYNLAGIAIDEAGDSITGYMGQDLTEERVFSSATRYDAYAGNILLIAHKTLNREKFVRLSAIGTGHSELLLGRYGLLNPQPRLDADGEYVEDELYTINID